MPHVKCGKNRNMNFLMYYMHLVVTAWAKRYDFKTDLILKHIKNCVNIFMPSDPYRSVAISNLYCTELIFREILGRMRYKLRSARAHDKRSADTPCSSALYDPGTYKDTEQFTRINRNSVFSYNRKKD